MSQKVMTGLDRLIDEKGLKEKYSGNIGYLGHSAAVYHNLDLGLSQMIKTFGSKLIKAFGPQHGFVTDVQDNMIETADHIHPHFKIPIHSLYGETRIPTDEMLSNLDTIFVDLQDVGTRVYTYITTMSLLMDKCTEKGIKVVILDRPNPVGGVLTEGPILEKGWESFVGHHPIPQRHSLTLGEVAKLQKQIHCPDCDLEVISMKGWTREMHWQDCNRHWINPSPNLPTPESALTFCGTVLFEGTNISEGRGTTRSLELLGAPGIEPYSFTQKMHSIMEKWQLKDCILRPCQFYPMFQKHSGQTCGGFQIHPTNPKNFLSWRLGALALREFYHQEEFSFEWNDKPYEYQFNNLAIDFINAGTGLREWAESNGSLEDLEKLENTGKEDFLNLRENIIIY